MNDFEIALDRYQRAYQLMMKKERLKREMPPKGSAFYRYDSDSPSHSELYRQIDNLTE